jgi:hypothetical protein
MRVGIDFGQVEIAAWKETCWHILLLPAKKSAIISIPVGIG